jgi:hypothetical protein
MLFGVVSYAHGYTSGLTLFTLGFITTFGCAGL